MIYIDCFGIWSREQRHFLCQVQDEYITENLHADIFPEIFERKM